MNTIQIPSNRAGRNIKECSNGAFSSILHTLLSFVLFKMFSNFFNAIFILIVTAKFIQGREIHSSSYHQGKVRLEGICKQSSH